MKQDEWTQTTSGLQSISVNIHLSNVTVYTDRAQVVRRGKITLGFILMRQWRVSEALTTNQRFEQEGVRLLEPVS